MHIPGLSYSGVKSPTECQQSLFESHFASRQSLSDRKSGSAGMPRPISYAVFCLKKKNSSAGIHFNILAVTCDHQLRFVPDLAIFGLLRKSPGFFSIASATPCFYTLSLHDALPI